MSSQTPTPRPEDPKHKIDSISDYVKHHSRETITYVLLVLGIVLLFFQPLYGGTLVGIVTGIYFGDEIVNYLINWKGAIDAHGIARNLILGGVAVAFFISAPAIFIGMAIAIGIKQLFVTNG